VRLRNCSHQAPNLLLVRRAKGARFLHLSSPEIWIKRTDSSTRGGALGEGTGPQRENRKGGSRKKRVEAANLPQFTGQRPRKLNETTKGAFVNVKGDDRGRKEDVCA